jgi:hypothetical protein
MEFLVFFFVKPTIFPSTHHPTPQPLRLKALRIPFNATSAASCFLLIFSASKRFILPPSLRLPRFRLRHPPTPIYFLLLRKLSHCLFPFGASSHCDQYPFPLTFYTIWLNRRFSQILGVFVIIERIWPRISKGSFSI